MLTAPVDYVFGTDLVLNKLSRLDKQINAMTDVKGKELWITGDMDEDALETFKAKGWKVVSNAGDVFDKE